MNPLVSTLRASLRSVRRSPGFALSAILTLALGLAGALALATVVHGVLLRPLPYPGASRLAAVTVRLGGESLEAVSPTDMPDLEMGSQVCEELLLFGSSSTLELEAGSRFCLTSAQPVDINLLAALGARPEHGRLFQLGDGPDVVVLTHEAWHREFGGDLQLVGHSVQLDGRPRLVAGITAPGFRMPDSQPMPDAFLVLDRTQGNRGGFMLKALARLRPGVSLAQLNADFAARSQAMAQAHPDTNQQVVYRAEDLQTHLLGDRSKSLLLALGLAGLLLLIACVNVAHLFLTRSLERRQELALRWALGAGPGEMLRLHLAEGLVVGLPAAALGLAGAWLAMRLLPVFLPQQLTLREVRPDGWEVLLALVLVLLTSLLFALLPLRQGQDPDLGTDLRSGTRTSTPGGRRLRGVLVAAQSALAVVMLAMGGLFTASFLRALRREPGYHLREGVAFTLTLPKRRYSTAASVEAMRSNLQARLETLPGVRSAVFCTALPNGRGFTMITCVSSLPVSGPMGDWPTATMVGTTPG
ncbi:FtsX-like permease family protein [Geothrix sp. PMB-07]|uniref:FtsX-like permease family protein n=1 Tax=Geothrix sp. PMB-07 TaxID=3068640 RepID=UPI0027416D05|nr:FtsX-like permease family protein [Geothrix sp. PMB-07]WLT31884.1 ABC transporter permease [Geothrix sp. PMB-07]